jgi:hypothetical protein
VTADSAMLAIAIALFVWSIRAFFVRGAASIVDDPSE